MSRRTAFAELTRKTLMVTREQCLEELADYLIEVAEATPEDVGADA